MKIIIAGGSGFLGRPLADRLASARHEVVLLSRSAHGTHDTIRSVTWMPDGSAAGAWAQEIDGAGAVVNLAGESLADKRWSAERKRQIHDSRILSTRSLVAAIRSARRKPEVLLNGSAVGYYGDPGDRAVDESYPPGSDFLATLCVDWEAEARAAEALGCRVVIIRTGIALDRRGGALKAMIRPFRFFAGGPLASGNQFVSWVYRGDWVALVLWALERRDVSGVLNGTAPSPVTSRELSRALGRALHRPSWLPVPAFALRWIVGEMADVALIDGQRVFPKRAVELGFVFQYPTIDGAMRAAVAPPV